MNMEKTVFLTGATGVMGLATLDAILSRGDCRVRLLARDSIKNLRLLRPYIENKTAEIVWGDLLDYPSVKKGMGEADIVIHMGGMVSPMADRFPEKTMQVNIGGTKNVIRAVKERKDHNKIRLIYIGSVAQMSLRNEPNHWGRVGDPLVAAEFDFYGLSKIKAEREVAESGLQKWVCLRQTGILHPGLFLRGSDPITFHVPLRGALEWATVEDSAKLMSALCGDGVPETFWRNFYNIGSGKEYRLSNYEFEKLILEAAGSPSPEKIFEPGWFATRNFHGCWFLDSDRLEELVPFRENIPVKEYFRRMVRKAPWWVRLAPLAPAALVKGMMKRVAKTKDYGTLDWLARTDCEDRIKAFFGSREAQALIPGWKDFDLSRPTEEARHLSHGYDERKSEDRIGMEDCRSAAAFRGGRCLTDEMADGDIDSPIEWECAFGHRFRAAPRTVLKGGHWCPDCLPAPWAYGEEAKRNPFLAQVIRPEEI